MSGLESVVADLLGTLSNAGLQLDPLSQARLRALEGHRVWFDISLPTALAAQNLTLTIAVGNPDPDFTGPGAGGPDLAGSRPADRRLEFTAGCHGQPNAIVRGSMPALFAWLTGSDDAGSTLTFEGDEAVLAELTGILTNFEPDLAEPLTTFLGADAADNLIGVAETAFASLRSVLQGLGNAVQDTAGRSYVNSPNLSTLLNGLDDLQLRIDRLAAKVQAAEKRRGAEKRRSAEKRRADKPGANDAHADVRHVP